jgi:uncharacterized membrane protein
VPTPYGVPPVYVAPVAQQSTNGLAVASLVLGIVWLAGLGSLLALIFGIVSKRQIRDSGGRQSGSGMATAGIVLGIVGIVGAIFWIILIAVAANQINNCVNDPTQANCGYTNTGTSGSSLNSGSTGNSGSSFNNGTTGTTGTNASSFNSGSTGNTGTFNTGSTGTVSGFNVFALY